MGQKAGAKWAAAVDLQPMFHKSDRLPEHLICQHRFGQGLSKPGSIDCFARLATGPGQTPD